MGYGLIIVFLVSVSTLVFGNPSEVSVAAGQALVSENGKLLEVTTSERAVLDWSSFSIGAGETTRFIQPSANAAVLNRVTGGETSHILGLLQANGHVYLVNRNGVLIGKEGRIDTAGFVASTMNIPMEEFLAKNDMHLSGDSLGAITHLGTITTQGGPVVLIAHQIQNQGAIEGGIVSLSAGHEILLAPSGSANLYVRPDLKGGEIDSSGLIRALEVQIQNDGGIAPLAINLDGVIEGSCVSREGGKIFIRATQGNIEAKGKISASNEGTVILHAEKGICQLEGTIESPGGEVRILGEKVGLIEKACIDVSSDLGGGTVLIGGDYRGENPEIPTSEVVFVGPEARIYADAMSSGDGGKVILWADQLNRFYGQITARGGAQGGDGGLVEVSSPGMLVPNGFVSTMAPQGKAGRLLLDPTSICISPTADTCVTFALETYTPTCGGATPCDGGSFTGGAIIDSAGLIANLNAGNVTIEATTTNFDPPGIIYFNDDISWSADTQLTLSAGSDITLIGFNLTNTGSAGSVVFDAGASINLGSTTISMPTSLTFDPPDYVKLSGLVTLNTGGNDVVFDPGFYTTLTADTSIESDAGSMRFHGGISATDILTINATSADVVFFSDCQAARFGISAYSFTYSGSDTFQTVGAPADADISIDTTGDLTIDVDSMTTDTGSSNPDITLSGGGDMYLGDMDVTTEGNVTLEPDGDLYLDDDFYVSADGDLYCSVGGDITLGDDVDLETGGNLTLLAGGTITAGMSCTANASGDLSQIFLVADNNSPNSIGNPPGTLQIGDLDMTANEVLIYAAVPGINTLPSVINGMPYTPGFFQGSSYVPGTNEAFGVFYPNDPLGLPFDVYFKLNLLSSSGATAAQAARIALTQSLNSVNTLINRPARANVKKKCASP